MKKTHSNNYVALRPDGELTWFSVPTFYSIFDVQNKLPGYILFIEVEAGMSLLNGNRVGGSKLDMLIAGPCWVTLYAEEFYRVPNAPGSADSAWHYYKQIRDQGVVTG